MDVNVNVTIDLGDKTISLFRPFASMAASVDAAIQPKLTQAEPTQTEPLAEAAPPKPRRAPMKPKSEAAPVEPEKQEEPEALAEPAPGSTLADMPDDEKLEAIRAEVTANTKKGKSADMRAMLNHFGAARASELDVDNYDAFYGAIKRYGDGETLEAILK